MKLDFWIERFSADLLRSPERVKRLVEKLARDTNLNDAQLAALQEAAKKYQIPKEEFEKGKSLGKLIRKQVDRAEKQGSELLEVVAKAQKEAFMKILSK